MSVCMGKERGGGVLRLQEEQDLPLAGTQTMTRRGVEMSFVVLSPHTQWAHAGIASVDTRQEAPRCTGRQAAFHLIYRNPIPGPLSQVGPTHPPDKADVHTQATVLPAAFQAHEYAIRDRSPLWILCVAVNTDLRERGRGGGFADSGPGPGGTTTPASETNPDMSMSSCVFQQMTHLVLGSALQLPQDPQCLGLSHSGTACLAEGTSYSPCSLY